VKLLRRALQDAETNVSTTNVKVERLSGALQRREEQAAKAKQTELSLQTVQDQVRPAHSPHTELTRNSEPFKLLFFC
jgi:hypothetical protein